MKYRALEPSTIRRPLKPLKDSPYFRHNPWNPMPHDVIVADESYMMDIALFAKLLATVKKGVTLILLGTSTSWLL